MKGKELERLIGRHLDGELTEAEAEALSGALETSAAAREVFWEMAAVHGLTQEATLGMSPLPPTFDTRPSRPMTKRTETRPWALGFWRSSFS